MRIIQIQKIESIKFMKTISDITCFRKIRKEIQKPLTLILTMGNLHKGHFSLIKKAKAINPQGIIGISIFVNPLQFNSQQDYVSYPQDIDKDIENCKKNGVDLLFNPSSAELLKNHSIKVKENSLSTHLCGKNRKEHFSGVCTIVLKIINIFSPQNLIFGEKDYQQLRIIERMIENLNLDIKIYPCEIIREENGLAYSSRNHLLSAEQKKDAPIIYQSLLAGKDLFEEKGASCKEIIEQTKNSIKKSKLAKIEYIEIVTCEELQPTDFIREPCLLATAVYYDNVRLIDNIKIYPSK